jgi:hypothetical protein
MDSYASWARRLRSHQIPTIRTASTTRAKGQQYTSESGERCGSTGMGVGARIARFAADPSTNVGETAGSMRSGRVVGTGVLVGMGVGGMGVGVLVGQPPPSARADRMFPENSRSKQTVKIVSRTIVRIPLVDKMSISQSFLCQEYTCSTLFYI